MTDQSDPASTSSKPVNMGLQLFPPPPKKRQSSTPGRKSSTTTRRQPTLDARSESPAPLLEDRQPSPDGRNSSTGRNTPQTGRSTPQYEPIYAVQPPAAAHMPPDAPRSHTSFSEAPTLVRSNSNSSRTSMAKTGLSNGSPPRGEPIMRSIFPRYNPEIALEHQAYYPTQASPTHIPTTVLNRRPYSPSINDRSPGGLQSPMAMGTSPGRFPRGVQDEAPVMKPSSLEDMKDLWKVVNGWRVSASEGRTFCLKMTSGVDEPIHTLSCATQPFYTLKLIPTSTSAQMTLLRHDPHKLAKSSGSGSPLLPNLTNFKSTAATEVMVTTLEEAARRLPPNDGLVALLYPSAASDMVINLANKPGRADADAIVAAAERECGRLVWDEDSGKYYLVHPSNPTPFVISIASSPAWSKVEYTLEHAELPRNLVRLVRDGAGSGLLEVDTAVAAKMDCFYVVDVAITAIMLVALAEEKDKHVERFDAPPPSIAPSSPHHSRRLSSSAWTIGKSGKGRSKKSDKERDLKIEEFEMDLESQESVKLKMEKQKTKDEKIPGFWGLLWMLIKCFVWTVTVLVKGVAKTIIFLSGCLTSSKKK